MAQASQHANPVSCQRSAVSCRSFCARGHAFGTSPAFLKHHYLHGFSTTDTTSTITTTTHPITLYHIHTPSSMFHHHIYQTPAMYHIPTLFISHTLFISSSHQYLSGTRSIPHIPFPPLFTRFQRAPPRTTIFTLFYIYSRTAHTSREWRKLCSTTKNIDVDGSLHPSCAKNTLSMAQASQYANPVSCQRSAVSCR